MGKKEVSRRDFIRTTISAIVCLALGEIIEFPFPSSENNRTLKYVRTFCELESCSAMPFKCLVLELGNRIAAEKQLKKLWKGGLVAPTNYEIDAESGDLIKVPIPKIEEPFKDSTLFVLTSKGYFALGTCGH